MHSKIHRDMRSCTLHLSIRYKVKSGYAQTRCSYKSSFLASVDFLLVGTPLQTRTSQSSRDNLTSFNPSPHCPNFRSLRPRRLGKIAECTCPSSLLYDNSRNRVSLCLSTPGRPRSPQQLPSLCCKSNNIYDHMGVRIGPPFHDKSRRCTFAAWRLRWSCVRYVSWRFLMSCWRAAFD